MTCSAVEARDHADQRKLTAERTASCRLIRQLPPSVVNKIAAGEVIERPASVVKELMENSVDAGARRIDVAVEQGGLELIRVVDNGCGIAADELPLAVASHATSKIARRPTTCFASARWAFAARRWLRSPKSAGWCSAAARPRRRPAPNWKSPAATRWASRPAAARPARRSKCDNLFYNTPVRRKFLRATQTEMGHISEAFTRLALAHPQVHFTLRHNERAVYDLPPTDDWRERIGAFFGAELAGDLIAVESGDGAVRLSGYVANPSQSRGQSADAVSVSQRPGHPRPGAAARPGRGLSRAAADRPLSDRVSCASRCRPNMVDVNVHPTKLEVRFQEAGRLYSQLLGTLRTKFLTTDLTVHVQPPGRRTKGPRPTMPRGPSSCGANWSIGPKGNSAQLPPGAGGPFARPPKPRTGRRQSSAVRFAASERAALAAGIGFAGAPLAGVLVWPKTTNRSRPNWRSAARTRRAERRSAPWLVGPTARGAVDSAPRADLEPERRAARAACRRCRSTIAI